MSDYSYEGALQAGGATVHKFQQFGSYQGDWWALVTFNGTTGWIHGYYGSCSGCDAIQAEFGYSDPACSEHEYEYEAQKNCESCAKARAEGETKYAAFGRGYLDDLLTQEQAEKMAGENIEWDGNAQEMLDFVKAGKS